MISKIWKKATKSYQKLIDDLKHEKELNSMKTEGEVRLEASQIAWGPTGVPVPPMIVSVVPREELERRLAAHKAVRQPT